MTTPSPNSRLSLPPIELRQQESIGETRHVVRPATECEIVGIEEVRLSARVRENAHRLANGELILVTERRNVEPISPGITGILRRWPDDRLTWQRHDALDSAISRGFQGLKEDAVTGWEGRFSFLEERTDSEGRVTRVGLRPPQIGSLFAIGGHWSLEDEPATIVMPTGTGKTEVILSTLVRFVQGTMMVVVPHRALMSQTLKKCLDLGILPQIEAVPENAPRPVVGVISRQATSDTDYEFVRHCNVVVAVINSLSQGSAVDFLPALASACQCLVLDEAHHVTAPTWKVLRDAFESKRVLQLTATPYRRDGKVVDGKQILNYSLGRAQEDGYFKPIDFIGLYEPNEEAGDLAIAERAVQQLDDDLGAGLDHLLMVRVRTKARAEELLPIYQRLAGEHHPTVLHSALPGPDQKSAVDELRAGRCKIIICVNMLGEGFDLPQLKIASLHDLHMSLPVLLQFTGRFTRRGSSTDRIGDATVIANVANVRVQNELELLYVQDSDWNKVLRETSSRFMQDRQALLEFFENSEALHDAAGIPSNVRLNPSGLRPAQSATVFRATSFTPRRFVNAVGDWQVVGAWLNDSESTLFYVAASIDDVSWTRSRGVQNRIWDLVVAHHDQHNGLLYIHSAASTPSLELAKAITDETAVRLSGESLFRVFGRLHRLRLNNVGIKKRGRHDLRYSSFSGSDVGGALEQVQTAFATKSLLKGGGYEEGDYISVGSSAKGKIWSAGRGEIPSFREWCREVGAKLVDETINTSDILRSVLVLRPVDEFPTKTVLALLWPDDMTRRAEDNVEIGGLPLHQVTLSLVDITSTKLSWTIQSDTRTTCFELVLDDDQGHVVRQVSGAPLRLEAATTRMDLSQYFERYPPIVLYLDGTELEGSFLSESQDAWAPEPLPAECMSGWDWDGVDITTESIWRAGVQRIGTIQGHVAAVYSADGYTLVFDDDGPGEAADLICIKEDTNSIIVHLVHCKFSGGAEPGERAEDLDKVCQQAIRSLRWAGHVRFKRLCKHIECREKRTRDTSSEDGNGRESRFISGDLAITQNLEQAARFKHVEATVVVVQPGVSITGLTTAHRTVLASTRSFLLQTAGAPLELVGSP